VTSIGPAELSKLKALVQAVDPPTKFEHLVAALIGGLIGTTVAVAKSGFQHGADAGTAGREGRFLRVECKRYLDKTRLDDRQLLGEMDHALAADKALEAWILASTRNVPEQLERQLFEKGEGLGIPVLVIDWKQPGTPSLVALMASCPALVTTMIGKAAGDIATRLQPLVGPQIDRLRCELAGWQIGITTLRRLAWGRLENMWRDPRESQAHFGQVVSGGARPLIHRAGVLLGLDAWWASPPTPGSTVCVTGLFGVGKTWAVADWLIKSKDALPIVLLVPASAMPSHPLGSSDAVKTFLAQQLRELTKVRDLNHWRARLERLLLRPLSEGCALLVVLDGMSQQSTVDWKGLFRTLQGSEFTGRIRTISTTRTHHFESRLLKLAGLIDKVVQVKVDLYDDSPGGELDQMLDLHKLSRADLHPGLHALARNPRLFELVIRFRERLVDGGAITLHRLLWEYGRDTAAQSMDRAMSPADWADWLRTIAEDLQKGIKAYSLKDLSERAALDHLGESEVYQRLSEIIDTSFVSPQADGRLKLSPVMVAHALGATAVHLLSSHAVASRAGLESALSQWLDPIAGLDQRDEILRAAATIALASGQPSEVLGVLVTAWMQTQNLGETHLSEIHALAAEMPAALLDVIELSHQHTHAASRRLAAGALRAVDRGNAGVRRVILDRAAAWLRVVSRDVELRPSSDPEVERHRQARMIKKVGADVSGEMTILGEQMLFVDRNDAANSDYIPTLMEGYPLADAIDVLRIAAVAAAIEFNHQGWSQLRWMCLLNDIDPPGLAQAVAAAAASIRCRRPEAGVHKQLGERAAAMLLRLSGRQASDEEAAAIDVRLENHFSYEEHYLPDPARSYFPLERRHALSVLNETSVAVRNRAHRAEHLWVDPTFYPPAAFCAEVVAEAAQFAVETLYRSRGQTIDDHHFNELQAVLARCAPRELAVLQRRWVVAASQAPDDRLVRSWHMTHALLVHGATEAAAARALRLGGKESNAENEAHAASLLLLPELKGMDALSQAITVIEADLEHIYTSITDSLTPLTTEQADALVGRVGQGTPKQRRDVVVLLATAPPALSDSTWAWVEQFALSDDAEHARIGLMVLAGTDAVRLGTVLDQRGWRFANDEDVVAAHEASGALFAATLAQPFEQVAERLAPWRLLEAVAYRGGDASEVRIAAELLDAVLGGGLSEAPDVGAQLIVRREADSTERPWYSVQPRAPTNPQSAEALRDALDTEAQIQAQRRASDIATTRIKQARLGGASLFLEFFSNADGQAVLRHCPELVARWLEGHEGLTTDFRRRVQLAEGLFLCLCEALLTADPDRGVKVWHSLRQSLRTRVTGAADIPALTHMIFRAPDSAAVVTARDELLGLENARTDLDLYDLALAARLNGRGDWIDSAIARDAASDLPWRQRRAAALMGFKADNTLPVEGAWTEGYSTSWAQDVRRRSDRFRYFEACARHWWKEFWRQDDEDLAYAAWVLFSHCADRRALAWMQQEADASSNSPELKAAKYLHWRLNRVKWKHGADRTNLNLKRRFLGRDIDDMVWPWRE
jgi:hypothetical protein